MKKIMGVLGVVFCLMLAGCASQKQDTIEKRNTDISKDLTYDHSMELEYAKMFAVDYYQNDYALVTIADDGKYLIVPEGESVPEDMDKDITVLQQPIQNIYLAASAAMARGGSSFFSCLCSAVGAATAGETTAIPAAWSTATC